MTDRLVKQIAPLSEAENENGLQTFSKFADCPNIILLGDPGAGKSHLFQYAAEISGGKFISARNFLNAPLPVNDSALFIDGLDEKRAGRGDGSTIDAMVQKLFTITPTRKIRISCRIQDWLGETDLSVFLPYFNQRGGFIVLVLEPLVENEQHEILRTRKISDPVAFIEEARRRELGEFLNNPQNLIMLADVVIGGNWPSTRRELFESWSSLLLTEHNSRRSRSGSGVFTAPELRDSAGAICAARLIADVEGICLNESSIDSDFPSYRTITFLQADKTQAALVRRVFVAKGHEESVDYAHRTTAEYLAAGWLAQQVRAGLPIRRVRALLGIDGYPASELRGLHAWLAALLPEQADFLIDTDPYGVLTYGDATAFSPSARKHLFEALAKLSESDPWFRAGNWSSPALGALSTSDMIDAFRSILNSDTSNFGIRSLVVDSIAAGHPLPDLQNDLLTVLTRQKSAYAERLRAFEALLKIGDAAIHAAVDAYHHKFSDSAADIRLRAEILSALYNSHFNPGDASQLFDELLKCDEELPMGTLWSLTRNVSTDNIPELLDAFTKPEKTSNLVTDRQAERRNSHVLGVVFEILLTSLLQGARDDIPADRLWKWLRLRHGFRESSVTSGSDNVRDELARHPQTLRTMFDLAVNALLIDDAPWSFPYKFHQITLHTVNANDFLKWVISSISLVERGSKKEHFLYHLGFIDSCNLSDTSAFEKLYDMADSRTDLADIRAEAIWCKLEDTRIQHSLRKVQSEIEGKNTHAKNCQEFDRYKDSIGSGTHLGWLQWLASIYFNADEKSPYARLSAALDDEKANIAMKGFIKLLDRHDIPTLDLIVEMNARNSWYEWWHAIIAGMDEKWNRSSDLAGFSDTLLSTALAVDLLHPTFEREGNVTRKTSHGWKEAALVRRPDLVQEAYCLIARTQLKAGMKNVSGLYELLNEENLIKIRKNFIGIFLGEFPNATPERLQDLLRGALDEMPEQLISLAEKVLAGSIIVEDGQCNRWLVAAYVAAPDKFKTALETRASYNVEIIWLLRDMAGYERHGAKKGTSILSVLQMETIAQLTATHFPSCSHTGVSIGNQNAWDGSQFVDTLINQLSANPSKTATDALERMLQYNSLITYREGIQHALATQQGRRREVEFQQPDWQQAVFALSNEAPANVADLHALLVLHLQDIRTEIASANTDTFKRFWNEDSYGRIDNPKPEESCRDILVEILRVRLRPLGIRVEPEGHMVADKRADISVTFQNQKVLAELKRDYHADVWNAAEAQLDRFYTRDPEAKGYGIYIVFWFGGKRPKPIPVPPTDHERPNLAASMEEMLQSVIAEKTRPRIGVLVIDVSGE